MLAQRADQSVKVERLATTSQEELAAWLESAGLSVRQSRMSQGPFAARFDLVSVASSELRFSISSYGAATITRGEPPRGMYTFSFPLSDPEGLYFNQQPIQAGDVAVVRPGAEFRVSRPAGYRALVVYADARLLDRRCNALRGVHAAALVRGGSKLRTRSTALAACTERFARIADRAARGLPISRTGSALQEQLMDMVIDAVDCAEPLRGWSGRRRLVDRAWALVDDEASSVVSVRDLCAKLDVPIRTLDEAFRSGMGLSPKRLILGVRLNRARRRLANPDADTTVTTVATSLNFFHFGHFTHHYTQLFGETPSQTLRRARWC
jgi:AraC family ethanolamine operon transcriptional activator